MLASVVKADVGTVNDVPEYLAISLILISSNATLGELEFLVPRKPTATASSEAVVV